MTPAVQKANYVARGAGARVKMLNSAKYYTYRAGAERDERTWRDQDGQVVSYRDVCAGISTAAEQYTYSYRMVLSPGDGTASAALYQQHLAGMFDRYYFINHGNTQHDHVHVIGFRNTTLRREQLREQQLELTRRVALEREQQPEYVQKRQREREEARERELEQQRARHHEQSRGYGRGM